MKTMVIAESPNKDILLIAEPKTYHTLIFKMPEYYDVFKKFTDDCWRLFLGIDNVNNRETFADAKSKAVQSPEVMNIVEREFNDELQEYTIKFELPVLLLRFMVARIRLGTLIRTIPVLEGDRIKFGINKDYVVKKQYAQEKFVNSLPVYSNNDTKAVVNVKGNNRQEQVEILEAYLQMHGVEVFTSQPVENLYYRFVDQCIKNCKPVVQINGFVQYFTMNYFDIQKEEVKEGVFINYFIKREELKDEFEQADEMAQTSTIDNKGEEV